MNFHLCEFADPALSKADSCKVDSHDILVILSRSKDILKFGENEPISFEMHVIMHWEWKRFQRLSLD